MYQLPSDARNGNPSRGSMRAPATARAVRTKKVCMAGLYYFIFNFFCIFFCIFFYFIFLFFCNRGTLFRHMAHGTAEDILTFVSNFKI